MASIRKGANLYLKSNSILHQKSAPTPKTVRPPRENQNLNTCESSPLNTQDFATQYSLLQVLKGKQLTNSLITSLK